jgi:16S rRNA (cytosine967-C5)-methyltransferase
MGIRSVRPYLVDVTKDFEGPLVSSYDRILVDAPCSGLGTLRSHPEAKWHRDESDIRRLSRLQKSIVREVTPLLKPGGVLVYATCTLTREENEEVVYKLLEGRRDLVLEEASRYLPEEARQLASGKFFLTLPHRHNTDGFFAARMRKAG